MVWAVEDLDYIPRPWDSKNVQRTSRVDFLIISFYYYSYCQYLELEMMGKNTASFYYYKCLHKLDALTAPYLSCPCAKLMKIDVQQWSLVESLCYIDALMQYLIHLTQRNDFDGWTLDISNISNGKQIYVSSVFFH